MMTKKNGGNNKSSKKSTKSEIFRSTVGVYLKQKCYVGTDKFRKSDFVLAQNRKQFVFQKMLEADMHCGNCFQYSNVLCLTNNHQIVDQQFTRFSHYVESQNDAVRTELRRFYGPMLCHLYIELVKAREPKAAIDFLKKHAHLVAPVDTYETPMPTKINGCSVSNDGHVDATHASHQSKICFARETASSEDPELEYFMKLIQTLSTCTKWEAAESDPEVVHFRSSKYEIHTSQIVIDALCGFIEKRGHVLIVNLLYTWIHVHIVDNEVPHWTEDSLFLKTATNGDGDDDGDDYDDDEDEEDDDMLEGKFQRHISHDLPTTQHSADELAETSVKKEKANDTDAGGGEDVKVGHVQLSLQTLCNTREQLLGAQTHFPRFVKISERCRGLTSAQMDVNECHLAAGFNDSVVRLWQMNQHTNQSRNLFETTAAKSCLWELNRCLPEEEDVFEEDVKRHERTTANGVKHRFYNGKYEDNSYNENGGIELRGHGLGITDVRFSTHYPLLYSVSKDSTMRCWRAESYTCGGLYRGHRYPIWCMDESPVHMYVATGSKDLTARLWSLEREFPLITYAGHTQDVECITFHPNGNYIATGSTDLTIRMWCVTSGKLMRVFPDCKQPICSIAFSPDGKFLAAGGEETKVRIFDLAAGSQLCELKDYTSSVTSLAWSGNGQLLATVCRDGSLRVHECDKILATTLNSSSSSATSLTSSQRLLAITSNCQRLVSVLFNASDTICCIGT